MSTLTTEQHLDRILAKCKALLETARKRTPGKWEVQPHKSWHKEFTVGPVIIDYDDVDHNEQDANAAFIAACAGSAEAGWQATIAAIEGLEEMDETSHIYKFIAGNIIASWPEEIL